jgi:hypothetical protein
MGPGVRQFAEYQPFTPIIETMRGLLNGTSSAASAITTIAWCIGLTLVSATCGRARSSRSERDLGQLTPVLTLTGTSRLGEHGFAEAAPRVFGDPGRVRQ